MNTLNLNQRKLISEGLMNLSVALVSIGIVSPIVSKAGINLRILISIFVLSILTIVTTYFSLNLIKNKHERI